MRDYLSSCREWLLSSVADEWLMQAHILSAGISTFNLEACVCTFVIWSK